MPISFAHVYHNFLGVPADEPEVKKWAEKIVAAGNKLMTVRAKLDLELEKKYGPRPTTGGKALRNLA